MKLNSCYLGLYLCIFFFTHSQLEAQLWSQDFSSIDAQVERCPKKLNEDLPALTAYLNEITENELEQVRAIYYWITTHIAYDWKALEVDKRINHFTKDILERKVAVCYGYAQLFQEMCELSGISSHTVDGYAKGTATTDLPLEKPNHSWNAVSILGKWYLLDATWGSSTINKNDEFVQISNDDYFLIPPEQFVFTHLPGNTMWQLLPDPVPVNSFMHSDIAIYRHLNEADSIYAYPDSILQFRRLSAAQQRLLNSERTYRSHPTTGNGHELGHTLIDYAGILSDSVELLSPETDLTTILNKNDQIIQFCRQANALTSLYGWQKELFINTLINQAVIRYNELEVVNDEQVDQTIEQILNLLKEAQALLAETQASFFTRIAKEKCANYIDIVKELGQY